jgi:hypothetical protein
MSRPGVPRLLLLALLVARLAHADPIEPPPESPEGADYEAEPADSLEDDQLEVSFAAAGSSGAAPRRTRRVRFRADSLGGSVRDGEGDPLSGGTLEGRARAGSFGVGRLAPRWGRGLLMGSPAEPWSLVAEDRGPRAAFRGRAGEGAWLRGGEALRYQVLCGRFARRSLAAVGVEGAGAGLGILGDGRGQAQISLCVERGRAASECAMDGDGHWRAEGALVRALGTWALSGRVRGGHVRFRSLAEPQRTGPAQAVAVGLRGRAFVAEMRGLASLWRFRPGCAGARAALEARAPLGRGAIAIGLEEQHGVRREPASGAGQRSGGFRQGWWSEWRGGAPDLGLALRHEAWGARSGARDPVRAVTTVRVETRAPAGAAVCVTHAVFRVRSGESVYLPEAESDRLVLRAISGAGERTRVEIHLPAAGGMAHAALGLSSGGGRSGRPRWTLEWTRRTRFKRRG